MRAYAIVLVLALNFRSNNSFYFSNVSPAVRSRGNAFVLSAQTAKKGAFYSKDGSRADVGNTGSTTVSAESNIVVTKELIPMKARLVEEVAKEDLRAVQLESLLEAFQSAVGEKEQLITLETQILSEIREVKTKVTDEIILNELNAAIEEKSRLIDAERAICKEISAVSSSLASEVIETREKIAELQKVVDVLPEEANAIVGAMEDYQMLLKSSIESSQSRDETVLELIKMFDEATSKMGFEPDETAGSERSGEPAPSSPTALARQTMAEIKSELEMKSNTELASSAGKAVSKTAVALIAATASLFTATASFVRSPEAKMSTEAVKSASKAVSDMGTNIKDALAAASAAWDSKSKGSEEGINRVIEGVRTVISSPELKTALGLLGENAQKTASDAAKAAELASQQLGRSLKNSAKWKAAVADLNDSLVLLFAVLALSSNRLLIEVRADLNKQLPKSK